MKNHKLDNIDIPDEDKRFNPDLSYPTIHGNYVPTEGKHGKIYIIGTNKIGNGQGARNGYARARRKRILEDRVDRERNSTAHDYRSEVQDLHHKLFLGLHIPAAAGILYKKNLKNPDEASIVGNGEMEHFSRKTFTQPSFETAISDSKIRDFYAQFVRIFRGLANEKKQEIKVGFKRIRKKFDQEISELEKLTSEQLIPDLENTRLNIVFGASSLFLMRHRDEPLENGQMHIVRNTILSEFMAKTKRNTPLTNLPNYAKKLRGEMAWIKESFPEQWEQFENCKTIYDLNNWLISAQENKKAA